MPHSRQVRRRSRQRFSNDLVREVGAVRTGRGRLRRLRRHGAARSPLSLEGPCHQTSTPGHAELRGAVSRRLSVEPHRTQRPTNARTGLGDATGALWLREASTSTRTTQSALTSTSTASRPQFFCPQHRPLFEPVAFIGSVPEAGDPRRRAARPRPPDPKGRKAYVSFGTDHLELLPRRGSCCARHALRGAFAIRDRDRHQPGGHEVDAAVSAGGLERPGAPVDELCRPVGRPRRADLFVTHHGLNSTHEAIFQEVPMSPICSSATTRPGRALSGSGPGDRV